VSKDCYEVKGPLLKLSYCKNEKMKTILQQKEPINGLKFTRVGPEIVQRYQRMFIREIFARIFRSIGSFAFVLQFQPQKDGVNSSPTFFLVEDISIDPAKTVSIE
jgi:hypothetical protein